MDWRPPIGVLTQVARWFGLLPAEAQETIWNCFRANRYEALFPFSHGESTQDLHLIVQGRVKYYRWHPGTNRSNTLFILGPGQLFPLMDFMAVSRLPFSNHGYIESFEPLYTLSAPISLWEKWEASMPDLKKICNQ